jgi:hypothetical protein
MKSRGRIQRGRFCFSPVHSGIGSIEETQIVPARVVGTDSV